MTNPDFYFDYTYHAHQLNSKTEWARVGKVLIPGAKSSAIRITETSICEPGSIFPVIEIQGDLEIVASNFYELFHESQVQDKKQISNSATKAQGQKPTKAPIKELVINESKVKKKEGEGEGTSLLTELLAVNVIIPRKTKVQTHFEKSVIPCLRNYVFDGFEDIEIPQLITPIVERFLHILYWRKLEESLGKDKFVNLKYEYLDAQLGKQFRIALRWMKDNGIIECDNYCVEGRKCYGYRLNKQFANRGHHVIEITDDAMIKKVVKKRTFIKTPVLRWLEIILARWGCDATMEELRSIQAKASVEDLMKELKCVRDIPIIYEVDPFGNRVHTVLTNSHKELRQYWRLDGQPLYELDIPNSNPLMIAAIMNERGIGNPKYTEICEKGLFYDLLAQHQGVVRDVAKDGFMKIFAKPKCINSTLAIMKRLFPDVVAWTQDIRKHDYTRLSKVLQRRESKLVIYGVCDRIRRMDKRIGLFTIHDSILSTENNMDLIKQVMQEEFKAIGLSPQLKVKRC